MSREGWTIVVAGAVLLLAPAAPAPADVTIDMPPPPRPLAPRAAEAEDATSYENHRNGGKPDAGRLALSRYAWARTAGYPTIVRPRPLVFFYTNAPQYGYGGYGGYGTYYGGYPYSGYGGFPFFFGHHFFHGHHHHHVKTPSVPAPIARPSSFRSEP